MKTADQVPDQIAFYSLIPSNSCFYHHEYFKLLAVAVSEGGVLPLECRCNDTAIIDIMKA